MVVMCLQCFFVFVIPLYIDLYVNKISEAYDVMYVFPEVPGPWTRPIELDSNICGILKYLCARSSDVVHEILQTSNHFVQVLRPTLMG